MFVDGWSGWVSGQRWPQDVDGAGLRNGNAFEYQKYVIRHSLVETSHWPAPMWCESYLSLLSLCLDDVAGIEIWTGSFTEHWSWCNHQQNLYLWSYEGRKVVNGRDLLGIGWLISDTTANLFVQEMTPRIEVLSPCCSLTDFIRGQRATLNYLLPRYLKLSLIHHLWNSALWSAFGPRLWRRLDPESFFHQWAGNT